MKRVITDLYSAGLRFIIGFVIAAFALSASAQTDGQIAVGYSGREVAKSSIWGRDDAGTISAAIKLDADMLQRLSGVKICSVCAGLASRLNVEDICVWVRTSLDGDNLAQANASPKKGWNDIAFTSPCAIVSTECYVGYTLTLSDASYPISLVPGESEHGFYLNDGSGWTIPECTTPSVLSLLAIIEADNLAQYDLALIGAEVPARMKIGAPSAISLEFENKGSRTVSGANIRFTENGVNSELYAVPCTLAPGSKGVCKVEYTPLGDVRTDGCQLIITIESLTDGPDENEADNELCVSFNLCKYDFAKRVFIEEFTTQRCTNCPRAAEMLHTLITMPEYDGKVVMCARHSGFGTDQFTSDLDVEMLVMYGSEGTYCPAIMLDRTPFYSDGAPVTSVPNDLADLITLVNRCLAKEAYVDIEASAEYDPVTGKVRVAVNGARDRQFGTTPARISVYLIENDIYDPRQKGADGDYYQQHVVRDADSVWGVEISWDADDEFTYECLLDPSKILDPANAEIVVAVHDYDADDISNCLVNNAFKTNDIDWKGFSGYTDAIVPGAVVAVDYYDLQGRRLHSLVGFNGLVIMKSTCTDGSVIVRKIVL